MVFQTPSQNAGVLLLMSPEGLWTCSIILGLCYLASCFRQKSLSFPLINDGENAVAEFNTNAKKLIARGLEKFTGPFNLMTSNGPVIVLSPKYIDAVNQESNLDFPKFIEVQHLGKYDTFRMFRPKPHGMFVEAVMKGLTRNLPRFTKALSDEMKSCLDDTWAQTAEWHEVVLGADVLTWVSRLSGRILTGDALIRNVDWLRITKDWTLNNATAVQRLKTFPAPVRWPVERVLPICRTVRRDRAAAARILAPILAERKAEIEAAKREGREPCLPDDSIEWFRKSSRGRPYNDSDLQLELTFVTYITTSDLLGQALLNLGAHPEMVEPLRNEAVEVLKKHGWKKIALTELYILDSFLKETQRLKPFDITSMQRLATEDVELLDGVKIHKGQKTAISCHRMWSESDYEDPEKFDGFRYVKRRKLSGYEHKSHLISTSADHLGFGYGKHACPGRFFAANEVKIAMVHVLLKYDLKVNDPKDAPCEVLGLNMFVNRKAKINIRRRKEEIDMDTLVTEEQAKKK